MSATPSPAGLRSASPYFIVEVGFRVLAVQSQQATKPEM